jgi:hypothetical protein
MSVRSDILSAIETALLGISGVGDVFIGKYESADLEILNLPALFVFQGQDRKSQQDEGFGKELFDWDIVVEAWCQDTSVETLFKAIHTAMCADPKFGGKAIDTRRTGSQVLSLDPGRGLVAMLHLYEIQYEHPDGQP